MVNKLKLFLTRRGDFKFSLSVTYSYSNDFSLIRLQKFLEMVPVVVFDDDRQAAISIAS